MFEFYHKQYYHQYLKNKQYLLLFVKPAIFPTSSLSLAMFLSQNEMKWIKGHSVSQRVCWQPLTMAASHHGSLGSIPGQSICDVWWTKWHWDSFSLNTAVFPCMYAPIMVLHTDSHITSAKLSKW